MNKKLTFRDFSMPIALILIWGYFALTDPVFLSPRNLSMLMIEVSITATLALGMLMVILPGNIDLSAGSGVGLIGGIASVLIFQHNFSAFPALLIGLVVALVLWGAIGSLIILQRIPAFIITLGGLLIFRGLFWLVIQSSTVPVSRGGDTNLYSLLTTYYLPVDLSYILFAVIVVASAAIKYRGYQRRKNLSMETRPFDIICLQWLVQTEGILLIVILCNHFRGVPLPLVILSVVAMVAQFITKQTPFGRYLYAIGGNEEAAVISGINVPLIVIGSFIMMGFTVAITGFMETAYSGASTTTVGELMELDAVAACVIGGTSLRGGKGSVIGVLLGALVMASLLNGMTLMAVSPEIKYIARGAVLAAAVWMDMILARHENV